MEEEKTKVRAVLRRIFPEVVVDDALVSTVTHSSSIYFIYIKKKKNCGYVVEFCILF